MGDVFSHKEFLEYLKAVLDIKHSLRDDLSLADCHHPGLYSIVLRKNPKGELLRVFVATKDIEAGSICYHTHKYGVKIVPLTTGIINHRAVPISTGNTCMTRFKKCKTTGKYIEVDSVHYDVSDHHLLKGTMTFLSHSDIHTISCKEDSMWVIQENIELGEYQDEFTFGIPPNKEGMYNKVDALTSLVLQNSILHEIIKTLESYDQCPL